MLIKRARPRPVAQAKPDEPAKPAPVEVKEMPPLRVARTAVPLRRTRLPDNEMRGKVAITPEIAKQEIYECLQLVGEAEDAIDRAQDQITAAHARIESLMLQMKWNVVDDGTYIAKYKEQYTRQEFYVDPKVMRGAVSNDDFWRAIEVRMGVLRTILTEREVIALAKVTPARSLGYKLEVKKLGRKK